MIMTSIFYSPLIPHSIPIALVGTIIDYWTNKYVLLRKSKMPDMFSELMATFFANFLPYVSFIWSISFWYFYYTINSDTHDLTLNYINNSTS
jgi:hypothetical protein